VLCVWSTLWQAALATFAFHKVVQQHYSSEVGQCCWLLGGDRFLSHHELRPSVGPVLNPYLCPVYFSSPATLRLPSTTLAISSQPTHTGRESVDQWSRVPTGTVVEQIHPSLLLWMLPAFTVYRGQRRTLFPARD